MKKYFDLTGQVAVVTGCSTGLGVQMAKALANQGANIVAIARRQNLIEEVAKEITDTYGVETMAVPCDITDTDRVNAAVDEILARFGRIDILINNAGTGAVAPAEDITDPQFENEMQIDLFGTFRVARAVAKSRQRHRQHRRHRRARPLHRQTIRLPKPPHRLRLPVSPTAARIHGHRERHDSCFHRRQVDVCSQGTCHRIA